MLKSCLLIGYYSDYGVQNSISDFMYSQDHSLDIEYVGFYQSRAAQEMAVIGTHLINHGIQVECATIFDTAQDEITRVLTAGVDAVCLTTRYFNDAAEYQEIVRFCRSVDPDITIIIGGPFIYNILFKLSDREKQYLCQTIGADVYIMEFEYEDILLRLLQEDAKPLAGGYLPSMIYLHEDGTEYKVVPKHSGKMRVMDTAVAWNRFPGLVQPVTCVRTCISCPYDCAFCTVKNPDLPFRVLHDDVVIEELKQLKDSGRTQIINFTDETFNVPKKRFVRLLQTIINTFAEPYPWFSFIRAELVTEETAALMAESGCCAVMLGLESGSDRMLEEMNKQVRMEQVNRSLEILKNHNIMTFAFFICGFPTETQDSISQTIQFINESKPLFYKINPWTCELNTKVWKNREKYGLDYRNGHWVHDTMDSNQALEAIHEMNRQITGSIHMGSIDITYLLQLLHAGKTVEEIKRYLKLGND